MQRPLTLLWLGAGCIAQVAGRAAQVAGRAAQVAGWEQVASRRLHCTGCMQGCTGCRGRPLLAREAGGIARVACKGEPLRSICARWVHVAWHWLRAGGGFRPSCFAQAACREPPLAFDGLVCVCVCLFALLLQTNLLTNKCWARTGCEGRSRSSGATCRGRAGHPGGAAASGARG